MAVLEAAMDTERLSLANSLEGRIVLVSGAARANGIGAAVVRRLCQEGAAGAVIADYNAQEGQATTEAMKQAGYPVNFIETDVTDPDSVQSTVEGTIGLYDKIDVMVAAAGITNDGFFHKKALNDFDRVMDVNFGGVVRLARAVVPGMRERKYGRIVGISSIVGLDGNIGQTDYASSKSAMIGFMKSLAKEGGRNNVTANCVAPGFIETDMTAKVPEENLGQYVERTPLHRMGHPEEVADAVAFLVKAAFVTGQTIRVDGGFAL
jgi:NAD(P)-dependent dehydrogenase (short-subunit alcohol dehydrogenase family)